MKVANEKEAAGRRGAARLIAGFLLVLALMAVVAGCGGGSSSSSSTGSTEADTTETEPAASTESEGNSAVDLTAAYEGTFGTFPKTAPKPKPAQSVWVISLNEASPGVHSATQGVVEASKVMGWTSKVVDTKGSPQAATEGVKQAVAANAAAIVMNVIECGVAEAAIKEAVNAGIKVVATNAEDCDVSTVGNQPLYSAVESFAPGGFPGFLEQLAQIQSEWALSELQEDPGKVLVMHETDYYGLTVKDKEFAEQVEGGCPECEVEDVPFVYADVINGQLKGKVQAALVKNPDAKMIVFPFDATLALGGAAAIQGSGRSGELLVMGGECAASTVDLIYEGTVTACVGNPYNWLGWQVVDGINRLLDGQKVAPPSVGQQLVDKTHNLPPENQEYAGPGTDYAAEYTKVWEAAKNE